MEDYLSRRGRYCAGECGECGKVEMFDEEIENIANHLLANGVIVPPCKVGDIVYKIMDIESVHRQILEVEVLSIRIEDKMKFFVKTVKNYLYCYDEYSIDDFGKSVFLTREEAEQALPQPPKEVE